MVELNRMSKLSFEARDGVAVLKLDNPPVNSLGHELREALVAGLERANADRGIEALVLIGSGAGFSGGADIREFGTPKAVAYPNLRTVTSEIEDSVKPVIAAIGGVCMGGGSNWRWHATIESARRGRESHCRKSSWGCCRAPAELSGCRACSASNPRSI